MPRRRTRSVPPPRRTWMVSPSITRLTRAEPGGPVASVGDDERHPAAVSRRIVAITTRATASGRVGARRAWSVDVDDTSNTSGAAAGRVVATCRREPRPVGPKRGSRELEALDEGASAQATAAAHGHEGQVL